jgi:hypothetical protein
MLIEVFRHLRVLHGDLQQPVFGLVGLAQYPTQLPAHLRNPGHERKQRGGGFQLRQR